MTSFLIKEKTKESYEKKISTEPPGTQRCKKYAAKTFDDFAKEQYNSKTSTDVIEELKIIKKNEGEEEYEDTLYETLQKWINWNEARGIGNYTIRVAFSNLRDYLFHFGIKTQEQDIKQHLRFGKNTKEERYSLSQKEYRAVIDGFAKEPLTQALFLALGSSGMRIGEALNLRKKDLDTTQERIKVNIRPETKTRQGRSTYLSMEVQERLKKRLEEIGPNDYVFRKTSSKSVHGNCTRSLSRLIKRLGLDEKYESNGFHKITSHILRAYFFTKAVRKHGENYAHRMTGHGGYLMQYDRMTEDEKLSMYLELEPDLVIYDQTKNQLEIKRLKQEAESIKELREEVRKLREDRAKHDKKIVEDLWKKGVLPKNLSFFN